MTEPAIKSRPVYSGLQISPHARQHLFALEGDGAVALHDQIAKVGPEFLARAEILYVSARATGAEYERLLGQLPARALFHLRTTGALLAQLESRLATATMGTRLYVAGTEGFIGQVLQIAMRSGIDAGSVLTEHRGSLARRVQCVHCKAITEHVTHSPFVCSHCGLWLFVRDHYSRRIGAFQGVNIDAEAPGSVPPAEELFP
jgi:dimethylamine monooxygenase subunit C